MAIVLLYLAFMLFAFWWFWNTYRDIFHPGIIFIPQFLFLYGLFPVMSYTIDPDKFVAFAGGVDALSNYQWLTLLLTACVLGGAVLGSQGRYSGANWRRITIANEPLVWNVATGFGIAGVLGFLYLLSHVGGFRQAYGHAYGGGWSDSGWLLELPQIGIIGLLLIFLLRSGKGMRLRDWALVLLCISPVLIHGLLGARRGPTFITVMTVIGGYLYFMRKRINLTLASAGGVMLGAAMLFIVANRNDIYLGSELQNFRSPTEFFNTWTANEYLIGNAVVRYTQETGSYYGRKELVHLIARMTPKALAPNAYQDLSALFSVAVDFRLNAGVDPIAIATLVGWRPTVGSATGFVGAIWQEFQYASPFVALLFGYLYGYAWRAAAQNVFWRVMYVIAVSLSIYLTMQDIDAWLYRLIMLGGVAFLVSRLVRTRSAPAVAVRGSPAPEMPVSGP